MNKKNNQTTIIDVKFDEESKSELWIMLQDKEKRENAEICWKTIKNIAKFSLISKCYFPFYKNKFGFSAGSIFLSYSQHVKVPIKTGLKVCP